MTQGLITTTNLEAPDDFYEALIAMHQGLNEAQSQMVNAKLILLLANHIGTHRTLCEALALARAEVGPDGSATQEAGLAVSAPR